MSSKNIIYAISFIGTLFCAPVFAGGLKQFIDLASVLVVISIGAIFAIAVDGDKNFIQGLGMAALEQVRLA